MLTKQEILLRKGAQAESSRVRNLGIGLFKTILTLSMQNTNSTKCSFFLLCNLQIYKMEVCLNLYYIFIKARNYIEKNICSA